MFEANIFFSVQIDRMKYGRYDLIPERPIRVVDSKTGIGAGVQDSASSNSGYFLSFPDPHSQVVRVIFWCSQTSFESTIPPVV